MAGYGLFSVSIQLDILKSYLLDNKDIYQCIWKEDIYMQGNLGKLIIFDRTGLKEYGPLTGDETITLAYGMDGAILKTFSMIKINKIARANDFKQGETSVLELIFTETYHRNLTMKRYSKSWSKAKSSEIVSDIIKNMLEVTDQVEIEDSDTTLDSFCMPWWTPAETIRYLAARAKGTKGKCNYGYLFYANSDKNINFVTLDNLLNNAKTDPDTYLLQTSNIDYSNKILTWEVAGVDHIGIRELGGGQMLGFDPSSQSFLGITDDESFLYSEAVKKITTLGQSSLFDGDYVDNDPTKFNYTYSLEGESDPEVLKNMFYNNFIRRYSLQNSIKAVVLGHNKRYAGQKVTVQWPSMNEQEFFSSMDSGQYLIKAIVHMVTPLYTPYYVQTLTLMKNAYQNNKYNTTTSVSGLDSLISSVFQFGGI